VDVLLRPYHARDEDEEDVNLQMLQLQPSMEAVQEQPEQSLVNGPVQGDKDELDASNFTLNLTKLWNKTIESQDSIENEVLQFPALPLITLIKY